MDISYINFSFVFAPRRLPMKNIIQKIFNGYNSFPEEDIQMKKII